MYAERTYYNVVTDSLEGSAGYDWFIRGAFISGFYKSKFPPMCADGKVRCPFCFSELKADGTHGLSYGNLDAERDHYKRAFRVVCEKLIGLSHSLKSVETYEKDILAATAQEAAE